MLENNTREHITDKWITDSEVDTNYKFKNFVRLSAKNKIFICVDFSYSSFDDCYLRGCKFINCKFIGVNFINSNFEGSNFEYCDFIYAKFKSSYFHENILTQGDATRENLRRDFARSLRTNFRAVGDVEKEHRATKLELNANAVYLKNAWLSNNIYYRDHYKGWDRLAIFGRWVGFSFSRIIWGNGESLKNLLLISLLILSVCGFYHYQNINLAENKGFMELLKSMLQSPSVLFGQFNESQKPNISTLIMFVRLILFSLFITIAVRKWGYR